MASKIFVNLPVSDLQKTIAFFTRLGFTFNPNFTDDKATCMIISEEAFAMLLVRDYFQTFIDKPITDAHKSTEVLIALSLESRAQVDEMVEAAVAAGGTVTREAQDHGFMYQRSFNDLDGHIWEVFWMDENAVPPQA